MFSTKLTKCAKRMHQTDRCCKQELEEKDIEIEFYKEQERVHREEIQAYKKVEVHNR